MILLFYTILTDDLFQLLCTKRERIHGGISNSIMLYRDFDVLKEGYLMIEIEKPKIETVEINDDAKFGKFVVEPLERGYGTTLGNSLRRILLSSLPGAAVTSIQIDGVLHEFSTIEGVVEDVTSIILNIKKLALKIYSDEEKTLEIDVQGEGPVKAATLRMTVM